MRTITTHGSSRVLIGGPATNLLSTPVLYLLRAGGLQPRAREERKYGAAQLVDNPPIKVHVGR
jgi:hypothetical protein